MENDVEIDDIFYELDEDTKQAKVATNYYCSSNLIIPESITYNDIVFNVTEIDDDAFRDCSGITSITIPNSVTNIGDNAFGVCDSLISIVVAEDNTMYDSRNNCNAIIKTSSNELILGCKNTIIPDGVIKIGACAFEGCKGITSINIPNSVTVIGRYAFSRCRNITSIIIGNNVTTIDKGAFQGCTSLTSITIPQSVNIIDYWAFEGCDNLNSVFSEKKVKQSFLSNVVGNDGVTRNAKEITMVGTCILFVLFLFSFYFHNYFLCGLLNLVTGLSPLFIVYIAACILYLDKKVDIEEPLKFYIEKPIQKPKPKTYKLTVVWGIVLIA